MELLKKLCGANAVSANETEVAQIIKSELSDCVDEIRDDCLGNVIAHKKGNGRKIMVTARMDEAGGLVTYAEDDGRLRFNFIGECVPEQMLNMTAVFAGGVKGVICAEGGKSVSDIKVSDMYVDIGGVCESIGISDVFCVCGETVASSEKIIAKSAAARSGVYALIEAVKKIGDTDNDIYAVFTSRSQVGFKGAKTAGADIKPDIAICIGETAEGKNIKCSGGAVLNLKSANSISDKELADKVRCIADENKLSYVCDISKDMSECAMIKKTGDGVKVLGISIPVRYKNAPRQSVCISDVNTLTELLVKITANL